jgi:hypothetical protein
VNCGWQLDPLGQVLLDKARAQMDVHLDQWAIPDGFEAVNLAGLRVRALLGARHNDRALMLGTSCRARRRASISPPTPSR